MYNMIVLVSLTQLVGTMYNICKVRSLNRHHQKNMYNMIESSKNVI